MKNIVNEWQNLVNGKKLNKNLIPDYIYDSWLRCLEFELIPEKSEIIKVSANELKRRKEANKTLLDTAMPIVKNIYELIQGFCSVVILTDKDGIIIESFGDKKFVDEISIAKPGTSWHEDALGTNGVGTALYLKKPIQIKGLEHFFKSNHIFSCSAAPIFDYSGKILGCIDISTKVENVQLHTLGMVASAAYAINRQLELNETLRKHNKTLMEQKVIVEMMTLALISVDSDFKVVHINTQAKEMLSLNNSCRGIKLSEILNSNIEWEKLAKNKKNLYDTEQNLIINKKKFVCVISSSIVTNEFNEFSGIIITLKPKSRVYKAVNKYSGSTATLTFDDLIGSSVCFKRSIEMAKIAGKSSSNVLILGESGTGKELFAQSIHNVSYRKDNPFIAVNCGALPRELVQTELFGYVGGAYTGSLKEGHPGKFELAEGGTIFLDEIGDLPLEAQANLLRVLQNREVVRVGGSDSLKIDVRVIAATNRNLLDMISEKMFREDLYYRLNVLTIEIPPLRKRSGDLIFLIDYLLKKHGERQNKRDLVFSEKALIRLQNYTFPGNIRELENIIESAVNITNKTIINEDCIPERLSLNNLNNNPKPESKNKKNNFESIKHEMIFETLQKYKGNISKTAKALGISRGTIYLYLKKSKNNPNNYRMF